MSVVTTTRPARSARARTCQRVHPRMMSSRALMRPCNAHGRSCQQHLGVRRTGRALATALTGKCWPQHCDKGSGSHNRVFTHFYATWEYSIWSRLSITVRVSRLVSRHPFTRWYPMPSYMYRPNSAPRCRTEYRGTGRSAWPNSRSCSPSRSTHPPRINRSRMPELWHLPVRAGAALAIPARAKAASLRLTV